MRERLFRESSVFLLSSDPVYRFGIRSLLERNPRVRVVGEAGDGGTGLTEALSTHWQVLILDDGIPGKNSLEIIRLVKTEKPNAEVILLFSPHAIPTALWAAKEGARGLFPKGAPLEDLLACVNKVIRGRSYVPDAVVDVMLASPKPKAEFPIGSLSSREHQVLCCTVEGKTLAQIADELSLCITTVSTYRRRVHEKLGTSSNVELANMVHWFELGNPSSRRIV
jgi:DNA-binding NarL/FixJ family response regulator